MKLATITLLLTTLIFTSCNSSSDPVFLRRVCAIAAESDNAFVFGDDTGVKRITTDGGNSFVSDTYLAGGLTDAAFNGEKYFYTTTNGSILRKVGILGEPEEITFDSSFKLNSITFPTPSVGYAVGDSGFMALTKDGGQNFVTMQINPDADLYDIDCLDGNTCFVAGSIGLGYVTRDGGATYSELDYGLDAAITFRSVETFGVRGVYYGGDNGTLVKSTDSGITFNLQTSFSSRNTIHDIYFRNEQEGFIGAGNEIFRTRDGSLSFESIRPVTNLDVEWKRFASAVSGASIFAGSGDGTVVSTPDFGDTFVQYDFGGIVLGGSEVEQAVIETPSEEEMTEPEITDSSSISGSSTLPIMASFKVSEQDFSFSHNVGSTECPQKIGQFELENDGDVNIVPAIETSAPVFAMPNGGFVLQPGQSETIMLFFDCSQSSSFNSNVRITGAVQETGNFEELVINASVQGSVS